MARGDHRRLRIGLRPFRQVADTSPPRHADNALRLTTTARIGQAVIYDGLNSFDVQSKKTNEASPQTHEVYGRFLSGLPLESGLRSSVGSGLL